MCFYGVVMLLLLWVSECRGRPTLVAAAAAPIQTDLTDYILLSQEGPLLGVRRGRHVESGEAVRRCHGYNPKAKQDPGRPCCS